MICQKAINTPGNRESRKCSVCSVEKAVTIAQISASAMFCLCKQTHFTETYFIFKQHGRSLLSAEKLLREAVAQLLVLNECGP